MPLTEERKEELARQLADANRLIKWALESQSARRINAALDLARSEVPVLPEQFDRDPMLLNCVNGTLDLSTCQLREHRREDYITKLCPVAFDPDAACPTWERFLDAVFAGDRELVKFVQRFLGYCLTGRVSEHVLPIFWGCGANGKSTLLSAVMEVMGDNYAMKANQDLLMVRRGERHPTELASLFGMRLVVASETSQGGRLNESLVKDLTGGERIRARRMREDFWEFDATHKVVLQTNHRPQVNGNDHATWRRLRLVPFEVTFWDPNDPQHAGKTLPPELRQDKELPRKLRAEHAGILSWLVVGCLEWQADGLTMPEKVRVATAEYRAAEDVIRQFIDECCAVHRECRVRATELYGAFKKWCERNLVEPSSQRLFGEEMTRRGHERYTSNGTWYKGLRLTDGEEDGAHSWAR